MWELGRQPLPRDTLHPSLRCCLSFLILLKILVDLLALEELFGHGVVCIWLLLRFSVCLRLHPFRYNVLKCDFFFFGFILSFTGLLEFVI